MAQQIKGIDALRNPYINQGSAFSKAARKALGIEGLLPPRPMTIELQAQRHMARVREAPTALYKYQILDSLRMRNRTLFFYLLTHYTSELMPIVYTPTVGQACTDYDHIFRATDGLFLSIEDKGRISELLDNCPQDDVDMIVVTDGERILGLGDLGTGGMGIPKGKLSLYTACGGIPPEKTLPVVIDVGTNNERLLADPLYLGLQHKRVDGKEYYELIEEFMLSVRKRWPNVVVQFEDFANRHAFPLLEQWRDRITCFNDDIQGTASAALTGFYSAMRVKGTKISDERVLFLGAGEAATGIAEILVDAMVEDDGLSVEQARKQVFLFDSKGLVTSHRTNLSANKMPFANDVPDCKVFADAVRMLRPTTIVGVAAQFGAFNKEVLGAMAEINERPVIFAISNPTSKAECTAAEAYEHTDGRALFASGSPFPPVHYKGRTFVPRQGNNSYIFPGLGLGIIMCRAKTVPQGVFLTASKALSAMVSEEDLANGSLYPALEDVRPVSIRIAKDICEYCWAHGIAGVERPDDVEKAIVDYMYVPEYPKY